MRIGDKVTLKSGRTGKVVTLPGNPKLSAYLLVELDKTGETLWFLPECIAEVGGDMVTPPKTTSKRRGKG